MKDEISAADSLKKLECISEPDERSYFFSRFDERGLREDTMQEHHADIARFSVCSGVPAEVAVLFETAKNIYLYAWYVYRFYPVAEQQALSALEMGLRKRFPGPLPAGYGNKHKPNAQPTLRPLLRYAIDQGMVKNEGFARWNALVHIRARNRMMYEDIDEMQGNNVFVKEVNLGEIILTTQDRDVDFVGGLYKSLPGIRNSYAHGSTRLNKSVLGTFELVAEILAQVYPSSTR